MTLRELAKAAGRIGVNLLAIGLGAFWLLVSVVLGIVLLIEDPIFAALLEFTALLPCLILGGMAGFRVKRALVTLIAQGTPRIRSRPARWATVLPVCSLPFIVPASVYVALAAATRPPSDESLIRDFHLHEADLNQLVSMTSRDRKLLAVGKDYPAPKDLAMSGVDVARLALYRRLCVRAKVPEGFEVDHDSREVDFEYCRSGTPETDQDVVGFAYCPKPPPKDESSHVADVSPSDVEPITYRHIEGDWYLYYRYIME